MNNKGFNRIEMVCSILVISIIVAVIIHLLHPKFIYAKESTFIGQANNIIKAAINKYTSDSNESDEIYPDDVYNELNISDKFVGRVCYNIKSLKGKYLEKLDSSYQGSIEICTLSDCKEKTKIWLSNDKYFLSGAEGNVSKKDLAKHVLGINHCGYTY
ncbi:MAG: hypothetical protein IKX00_05295 [Bacilli bacterium]|nr:hypothetical protein [Bacilli bacterium]